MSEQLQPIQKPEMTQQASVPAWNRKEVSRCLLPVLRLVDGERNDSLTDEEQDTLLHQALVSCHARPDAYRQLLHVFTAGSEETLEKWFGGIDCDDELLESAFDFIGGELKGDSPYEKPTVSLEQDMYFSGLFRITEEGVPVDLSYPFEQYYFCDEVIYPDCQFRRTELADKCKAWIRHYRQYYAHIRAWYGENGGGKCAVSPEHHSYMELYDYFLGRIEYEDRLKRDREALEYERGGLGWFHLARKREIERELYELNVEELGMRLVDAVEKMEAYEAQFDRQRADWQYELAHAPLTAFGRKKELKQKLAAMEQRIRSYRVELKLDELQAEYNRLTKKKQTRSEQDA